MKAKSVRHVLGGELTINVMLCYAKRIYVYKYIYLYIYVHEYMSEYKCAYVNVYICMNRYHIMYIYLH